MDNSLTDYKLVTPMFVKRNFWSVGLLLNANGFNELAELLQLQQNVFNLYETYTNCGSTVESTSYRNRDIEQLLHKNFALQSTYQFQL